MKLCHECGQALAEAIKTCPSCGCKVSEGLIFVDDYRIVEIIHEGYASILCRATKESDDQPVALRLFTKDSGVDAEVAQRLRNELEELQKLPEDWFVRHQAINCSSEGMWYRVSEWVDAQSWGDLLSSGKLRNLEVTYDLFHRLAAILEGLHHSGHFIPHLTLSDILILKGPPGQVQVKIDYKLSRFLHPQKAKPAPMLQNLLDCHPDIIKGRPLNLKSDIWSLGRIFTQILAADLELGDPSPIAKQGKFPKEISILIRSMLTDDPDLRPRTMSEVAAALVRIKKEHTTRKTTVRKAATGEIRKLKKMVLVFGFLFALVVALGGVLVYHLERDPPNLETAFGDYADIYAGSVAFVVVEYQITVDSEVMYSNRTEGTAFLVDRSGYLLTNRHVACPWLEDGTMYRIISHLKTADKSPRFDYQMYLWFEGATAFNRLFGIGENRDIEDVYNIQSAYSRNGASRVEIAGVAKAPDQRGMTIKAPLREDFAVLKIDPVPANLRPLPLDKSHGTEDLKRLAPVIALGFPLGRTSQVNTINVSVTRGHVRRTFENFFQVDTSIYKGNSGGPIIDAQGRVIGIASAVATDVAVAPLPVITPLSDIGLVLPVVKAAAFIQDLQAGQSKWNGVVDLSAGEKIKDITTAAYEGDWREALELSRQSLKTSNSPALLMTAAMINYCTGNHNEAYKLFARVLSIDPDRHQARLMSYLIDLQEKAKSASSHGKYLAAMDWHSSGEFFGHLARIIEKNNTNELPLDSWNNGTEKGWIYYVAGASLLAENKKDRAKDLWQQAAHASMQDEWPSYLALASLAQLAKEQSADGLDEMSRFLEELLKTKEESRELVELTARLMAEFEKTTKPARRAEILHDVYDLQPENKNLLAYAAFYEAMTSQWPQALVTANQYLELNGREEPLRLATRVLVAGILNQLKKEEEAQVHLKKIRDLTASPWYQQICNTLLDDQSAEVLIDNAGNVPEKILTAYTALGFNAEAGGDHTLAIQYYREALGSYLDNWTEYELARQRFLRLRDYVKKP